MQAVCIQAIHVLIVALLFDDEYCGARGEKRIQLRMRERFEGT
jgi:hypothetical protein